MSILCHATPNVKIDMTEDSVAFTYTKVGWITIPTYIVLKLKIYSPL